MTTNHPDYGTPRYREAVLRLILPIMHAKAAEEWDQPTEFYEVFEEDGEPRLHRLADGNVDPEEFLVLAAVVGARLPSQFIGVAAIAEAVTPEVLVAQGAERQEARIALVTLRGDINGSLTHVRGQAIPSVMSYDIMTGRLPSLMAQLVGNDMSIFEDKDEEEES